MGHCVQSILFFESLLISQYNGMREDFEGFLDGLTCVFGKFIKPLSTEYETYQHVLMYINLNV